MPEAKFTTGEFAALCNTTKATLFHYDKLGILRPTRDRQNNYRYYTDKQVADFDAINSLTEIGTPLSEIQDLMENWSFERYDELLRRKADEMQKKEHQLHEMRLFLQSMREEVRFHSKYTTEDLDYVELPALRYAIGPGGDLSLEERRRFLDGTRENIRLNRERRSIGQVSIGSIVLKEKAEMGEYFPSYYYCNESSAHITGETFERPAGTYARFFHIGERRGIGSCIRDNMQRIHAQGWKLAGNIYVDDHLSILIPLAPVRRIFPIYAQVERA